MPDPRDQYPIYVPPTATDINEKYPIYEPLPPPTPSWTQTAIGTGLSILPSIPVMAGAIPSGGWSLAGLGAAGLAGSGLRQWYEQNQTDQYGRPLRQEFNPYLAGIEGVSNILGGFNKFPGFGAGIGALTKYGAGQALEGAAISGATEPFVDWAETGQFNPNLQRMGQAAGTGALFNTAAGFGMEGGRHYLDSLPPPLPPPGAYDVQRPPTNLFDVPTPPGFARQQTLPGMEDINFGASYPPDATTPSGMYRRQADSLFGPSEAALQSGDPDRMGAITSQYDANAQQAEAFRNRQPSEPIFSDITATQSPLPITDYRRGGQNVSLYDMQNLSPDAFNAGLSGGIGGEKSAYPGTAPGDLFGIGDTRHLPPKPPPPLDITGPPPPTEPPVGPKGTGSDFEAAMRASLDKEPIADPTPPPNAPSGADQFPEYVSITNPADKEFTYKWKTLGYYPAGTDKDGYLRLRRPDEITQPNTSPVVPPVTGVVPTRKGAFAPGETAAGDIIRVPRTMVDNKYLSNIGRGGYTKIGEEDGMVIFRRTGARSGEVESGVSRDMSREMAQILVRLYPDGKLHAGDLGEFDVRKKIQEILNDAEPGNLHDLIIDYRKNASHYSEMGDTANATVYQTLSDAAQQRYLEIGGTPTRTVAPEVQTLGGLLGRLRRMTREGRDETSAFERLVDQFEETVAHLDPRDAQLMHSDIMNMIQETRLSHASSDETELLRQMAEIVRQHAVTPDTPTSRIPPRSDDIDMGGAMGEWPPGNKIYGREPPPNTGQLALPGMAGPRGVPDEGGLDVGAIRQRAVLDQASSGQMELPTPTQVPVGQTVGVDQMRNVSGKGGAEVESSSGNPKPPAQPISKFRRRVLRIRESLKRVLQPAPNYSRTRFLLPDGTRLTHPYTAHEYAAMSAGTSLQGVLEAGVIRVTPGFESVHIEAPITMEQAQVLADIPILNGNHVRVDVYNASSKKMDVFEITEETTARQLREKVNAYTWRGPKDELFLEQNAVLEDATDSWNGMTRVPINRNDNTRSRSYIYDRNQVLTDAEKDLMANHPIMVQLHIAYNRMVKRIIEGTQATGIVNRTGTVIDPGVLALYKEHPKYSTQVAILVNTLEHIRRGATPAEAAETIMDAIYHELGHVNPSGEVIKFDPRAAMQDPSLGRTTREYLRMQVMHGEADKFHDVGWLSRMIDFQRGVGAKANAEFETELRLILTSKSGGYRTELSDILQLYTEAARRSGPEIEPLITAGVESGTPGQAEGAVPSDTEGFGGGVARPGIAQRVKQSTGWGQGRSIPPKHDPNAPSLARELVNLPTNLTTTADLSYPGRQGLAQIFTPEFWKGLVASGRAATEGGSNKVDAEIRSKPLFQERVDLQSGKVKPSIAEEDGLDLMALGHHAGPREEATASRYIETGGHIPVISAIYRNTLGVVPRISNRMYTTFLNYLRANRYEKLMNLTRNMAIEAESGRGPVQGLMGGYQLQSGKNIGFRRNYTAEQAAELNPFHNRMRGKEIADFVNTATGRGPLRMHMLPHRQAEMSFEKAAGVLSYLLFAPRNTFSRMRMLNPNTYIMATPFVRKQYLKAALSTAAAWWAFTEMAKMADPEVEVSHDLTSADFGKVRIGNFRMDPAGGFQQFLVAYARLYQGGAASSSTGQFHKFGEGFQAQTQFDMGERLFANKLNPVAKFAWDLAHASEYNPFHVGDRSIQMFVPLIVQDFTELQKEDPDLLMPWMVPILFGAGSQIYSKGESISKFLDPQDDMIIKGGGVIDAMPQGIRDMWDVRGGGQ